MTVLELLKGKKIMITTDMGVVVEMEIASVTENWHSEDLAPSTRENDWWPPTREWNTFTVMFTNGFKKEFNSVSDIKIH